MVLHPGRQGIADRAAVVRDAVGARRRGDFEYMNESMEVATPGRGGIGTAGGGSEELHYGSDGEWATIASTGTVQAPRGPAGIISKLRGDVLAYLERCGESQWYRQHAFVCGPQSHGACTRVPVI